MTGETGGESERLAPVIPLFGGTTRDKTAEVASAPVDAMSRSDKGPQKPGLWRSTSPLTGEERPSSGVSVQEDEGFSPPGPQHPARRAGRSAAPRLQALDKQPPATDGEEDRPDIAELRRIAEEGLVRKLRTRQLSVSEARQVLRTHGIDAHEVDDVIDDFLRRGYLDDVSLAQMLVTAGVDRKGQGRVAVSRSLAQRGIPRDVAAAALDELPDDDAERALEYARTKAPSLARLDHDTALRRLLGQLARRGYGGSAAMTAAKTALTEESFGSGSTGVRFVDSD
jgi:regulatory protein